MGIDNETKLTHINILFDNNTKLLEKLKENSKTIVGPTEEKEQDFLISLELGKLETGEYAFEEDIFSIQYHGTLKTPEGDILINLDLPISDIVLIDILQASVKRFNKLKTALETLK